MYHIKLTTKGNGWCYTHHAKEGWVGRCIHVVICHFQGWCLQQTDLLEQNSSKDLTLLIWEGGHWRISHMIMWSWTEVDMILSRWISLVANIFCPMRRLFTFSFIVVSYASLLPVRAKMNNKKTEQNLYVRVSDGLSRRVVYNYIHIWHSLEVYISASVHQGYWQKSAVGHFMQHP